MDATPNWQIKLLALDVALETTGFAIYLVSTGNFSFFLNNFGVIKTDSGDLDTRVRCILREVESLTEKFGINFILPEEPSMTIFGSRMPNILIGRATSVMKLMAATYSLVGWCHKSNLYCRTINPTSWQHSLLGNIKKGRSKPESLKHANQILKHLGYTTKLKTKEEENIADAINIGFEGVKRMKSGDWAIPNT